MIGLRIQEGVPRIPSILTQKTWYTRYYRACNTVLGKNAPHIDITVILTEDTHMKTLNHTYRKLARTTDVLSFYYGNDGVTGEGEIFISIPVAIKQAVRFKHSLQKEMARLLVHGILHVYGYDHMKSGERKEMRALEDKVLAHV